MRTSAGGFTLLEVIVAFAILGVAVVASIQGFAGGLRLLKLSGDHQGAMLLADQKLREALKPEEGREGGTEGTFTWERTTAIVPAPELTPEVNSSTSSIGATTPAVPAAPTTTTGPAAPKWRVYRIEVKVRWEQRSVQLVTLRTLPIEQTLVTQTGLPQTAAPQPGVAQPGVPQTGLPQTGGPSPRLPQTGTPRR